MIRIKARLVRTCRDGLSCSRPVSAPARAQGKLIGRPKVGSALETAVR